MGVAADRAARVARAREPDPGLTYDVVGASAVVVALLGVSRNRPDRRLPWILMAAGQASFVAGDLLWNYFEAIGEEPFPSFADVLYLGGYPFIALGLFLLIRRRLGDGDRGGILDAAILTTGAAVLSWTFLMRPVVADTELDLLSMAISLAYPIARPHPARRRDGPPDDPGSPDRLLRDARCESRLARRGGHDLRPPDARRHVRQRQRARQPCTSSRTSCSARLRVHPSMRRLTDPHPVSVTWLGPIRLVCLAAAMLTGPALLAMGPEAGSGLAVVAIGTGSALAARARPPRRPRRPAWPATWPSDARSRPSSASRRSTTR